MSSKATRTKTSGRKALLRSLPQSVVAEVFGVAPSWLRDNAHLLPRNDDGTYDAGEVAKALRSDYQPVELPGASLERALLLLDLFDIGGLDDAMHGAIGVLEQIDRDHGAAGMAAVTHLLLDRLRFFNKLWDSASKPAPSPEQIRSEYAAKAEAEIAELPRWGAWRELRLVARCEECGRMRRGGKWVKASTPVGYDEKATLCEACCTN